MGIEHYYKDPGPIFAPVGFEGGVELCEPLPALVPTSSSEKNLVQIQRFPCRKPEGSLRVITLGGSSTQGFGVKASDSFASRLAERMAGLSSRPVEVINAGVVGVTSSQVRALVPRLASFEPDLYVLYAGHNDFNFFLVADAAELTPRWVRSLRDLGDRWYLYRGLRSLAERFRPPPSLPRPVSETGRFRGARDRPPELLDRVRSVPATARGRLQLVEQERAVLELIGRRFSERVLEISREARAQGAGLLVLSTPCRIMDPPIDSIHWKPLQDQELADFELRWSHLSEAGHLRRGQPVSDQDLDAALALDDSFAHVRWLAAERARQKRLLSEARAHYLAALDLNPASSQDRAPPSFPAVLRQAALEADAGFVDLWPRFEARAELPGLPDSDLFMDSIHPSPRGHDLIAQAVAEWMMEERVVPSR